MPEMHEMSAARIDIKTVKREERPNRMEYSRLHHGGAEAAVILGVIGQQRRPRGPQCGEPRVIAAVQQIGGRLLHISDNW